MPTETANQSSRTASRGACRSARRESGGIERETAAVQRETVTATLLLACLAQFMVILDVSVVNVALPSIRNGLHFSEADLQWVVNGADLPADDALHRRGLDVRLTRGDTLWP